MQLIGLKLHIDVIGIKERYMAGLANCNIVFSKKKSLIVAKKSFRSVLGRQREQF